MGAITCLRTLLRVAIAAVLLVRLPLCLSSLENGLPSWPPPNACRAALAAQEAAAKEISKTCFSRSSTFLEQDTGDRRLMSGFDGLPFIAAGVGGIFAECDFMRLLGIADHFSSSGGEYGTYGEFQSGEIDVIGVIFQRKTIFDAVCARAACPGALLAALDFEKLPENIRGEDVQDSLSAAAIKFCDTNNAGDYCILEIVQDALAGKEDPEHATKSRMAICGSGCYEQLGAEFINKIQPVILSITGIEFDSGKSLCPKKGSVYGSLPFNLNQFFGMQGSGECSTKLSELVLGIISKLNVAEGKGGTTQYTTRGLETGVMDTFIIQMIGAVCEKTETCPAALAEAIDFSSLPRDLQGVDAKQAFRTVAVSNFCERNMENNTFCMVEVVQDI